MATEIEVRSESAGLMSVIEKLASNPDVDIDKLQRLLEMQERWQMNQAKAAFRESMAEFKLNPPKIIKDRIAEIKKDGRLVGSYSYADLESISVAITDGLAKVGITHSFKMKQEGLNITVICVLSKGMYSEEGVPLTSAPDTSGAKNSIQAIGSTLSYLEKYTLLGASGMSAGMPDDDGQGAGLPDDERAELVEAVTRAKNMTELKSVYLKVTDTAEKAGDTTLVQLILKAKNERAKSILADEKRASHAKAD
jgi:hypothetical protein